MLLAPLLPMSLTQPSARARARQRGRHGVDPVVQTRQRYWLLTGWAVVGGLAVLCIPALRGGPLTGLTLPFWLVAAPLIDIAAMKGLQRWDGRRSQRR